MDSPKLFTFVSELQQETRLARLAFRELRTVVNSVDAERVFLWVEAFLSHALVISRFLWPTREASMSRGKALREALGVADDSVLCMKGTRTELEQVDERYEDWLERLEEPRYVAMNVMPATALGDFKQDVFHRSLDPDTFKLELRGVVMELRPLEDALRHLEITMEQWKRSHQPW